MRYLVRMGTVGVCEISCSLTLFGVEIVDELRPSPVVRACGDIQFIVCCRRTG